jgi:DNA-binding NtrC family response regulator
VRRDETGDETVNKKVLLVDDEEMVLAVMGDMLRYLGYRVETRRNGKEAFDAFVENPRAFDLMITEYFMPRMRGTELAKKILELKPEWPVIIMSTGDEEMEGEAKAIGVRNFMRKPMGLDDLIDALESAFRV